MNGGAGAATGRLHGAWPHHCAASLSGRPHASIWARERRLLARAIERARPPACCDWTTAPPCRLDQAATGSPRGPQPWGCPAKLQAASLLVCPAFASTAGAARAHLERWFCPVFGPARLAGLAVPTAAVFCQLAPGAPAAGLPCQRLALARGQAAGGAMASRHLSDRTPSTHLTLQPPAQAPLTFLAQIRSLGPGSPPCAPCSLGVGAGSRPIGPPSPLQRVAAKRLSCEMLRWWAETRPWTSLFPAMGPSG